MKKIHFHLCFGLIAFVLFACQVEPINKPQIDVNLLDEELLDLVSRIPETETETSIDCIEFNYPVALFVFDENEVFIEGVSISGDREFITFLEHLPENHRISLNYPISGTLTNGEIVEITTNEELKEAIDACRAEELRGRCNRTLTNCVWKIGSVEGFPNGYEGAYYKLRFDGSVQFHLNNDVYFGTWVTLTIGYEVFLNIDLNDDPELEDFWNVNWLVDLRSDARIQLSDEGTPVLMEKDCSIPCVVEGYRVCEFEDDPGFANFVLEDYTPCIPIPSTHDVVSAVSYTFYETEANAELGIDPISSTSYINLTNPQTLYARVAYRESNELLSVFEFLIEAIVCPSG